LGDSAERPQFVETLPRRGYRFIGKITPQVQAPAEPNRSSTLLHSTWLQITAGILAGALCAVGSGVSLSMGKVPAPPSAGDPHWLSLHNLASPAFSPMVRESFLLGRAILHQERKASIYASRPSAVRPFSA